MGKSVNLDSTLASVLINAGVAGIMALLFTLGFIYPRSVVDDLKEERDALKEALMSERTRADAAVAAAATSRDLLLALQAGAAIGQHSVHQPGALPTSGES